MHSTSNLDDGYLGSGKRLRCSINKHGIENHQRIILSEFETRKALTEAERLIVDEKLVNDKMCMNLIEGGGIAGGMTGKKHSPESRRKISESNKGYTHTSKTRAKMSASGKGRVPWNKGMKGEYTQDPEVVERRAQKLRGKKRTPETKLKMSLAKKGKPLSESHVAALKDARAGQVRPPHTEEAKRKIGDGNRGKKCTGETRAKMSAAKKGKEPWNKGKKGVQQHSDETRAKMSVSRKGKEPGNKGKKASDETKAKMSAARKGKKYPRRVSGEEKTVSMPDTGNDDLCNNET